MESSSLHVFSYKTNPVRIVNVDDERCWVAKDVCECLGLDDARRAVERLEEDEWSSTPVIDALGRSQDTIVVNEPGLYSLILGSRKPGAKAFKRWVTHEVLPTLRRDGAYGRPEAIKSIVRTVLAEARQTAKQPSLPSILRAVKAGIVSIDEAREQLGLTPSTPQPAQRTLFDSPRPTPSLRGQLARWRVANPDTFSIDPTEVMVAIGIAPNPETAQSMTSVKSRVASSLRSLGVEPVAKKSLKTPERDFSKLQSPTTMEGVLEYLGWKQNRANACKAGILLRANGWTVARVGRYRVRTYTRHVTNEESLDRR